MDGWLLKQAAPGNDRKRLRVEQHSQAPFDHLQLTCDIGKLADQTASEVSRLKGFLAVFLLLADKWPPAQAVFAAGGTRNIIGSRGAVYTSLGFLVRRYPFAGKSSAK